MFNFYVYDKLEKEEERRVQTSSHNPRKFAKYINERDKLAEKYNTRIVEFLEQVAVEPEQFQVPDRYGAGTEAKQAQLMLYGGERFKFTNNSNDQDRIIAIQKDNQILDTQPLNITEAKAWNLRPRTKGLEIGPNVRYKPNLQMERIYDKLTSHISPTFADKTLTTPIVHKQVKSYFKSGETQHQQFSSTGGFSKMLSKGSVVEHEMTKGGSTFFTTSHRVSKLGNNMCVVQPQHILSELHKKSYFKGATGFMIGQEKSLGVKQTEKMAEVFAQISRSIQKKQEEQTTSNFGTRSRRNIGSSGGFTSTYAFSKRGGTVDRMSEMETPSPQKTSGFRIHSPVQKLTSDARKSETFSASVYHTKERVTEALDENESHQFDEPDPITLTNNVLKLCHVIRQKHAKVSTVHRSSGRGGQGPLGVGLYANSSFGMSNGSPENQSKLLFNAASHHVNQSGAAVRNSTINATTSGVGYTRIPPLPTNKDQSGGRYKKHQNLDDFDASTP